MIQRRLNVHKLHFGLRRFLVVVSATFIAMLLSLNTMAQQQKLKVRIAKIEVDSTYLTEYRQALAEHARIAVKVEPGVLALNAVYNKDHPTQVTVFEIYASEQAYQAHLKTPHFLKYKNGTLKMVKSLQLTEVEPIALQSKFVPSNH